MRRNLPLIVCGVSGILYVVAGFGNKASYPVLKTIADELNLWYLIVFAFAFGVGIVNLYNIHLRRVTQRRATWVYSLVLLFFMTLTLVLSIFTKTGGPYVTWLYQWMLVQPAATLFSVLAFYIASAAYRAFRIKSFDAGVLLTAGVLLMLGKAPITEIVSTKFGTISTWIMTIPNSAGMRGVTIAATMGGIATALRIVLGIERGHLGGSGQ